MSSNASAKATSEGTLNLKNPPGSEYAACEQSLMGNPGDPLGLNGNEGLTKEKSKVRTIPRKEVRSSNSSYEVE